MNPLIWAKIPFSSHPTVYCTWMSLHKIQTYISQGYIFLKEIFLSVIWKISTFRSLAVSAVLKHTKKINNLFKIWTVSSAKKINFCVHISKMRKYCTVCIYLKNHDPPICPICTVLSSLNFIFWKICKLHALLTFFYKLLLLCEKNQLSSSLNVKSAILICFTPTVP